MAFTTAPSLSVIFLLLFLAAVVLRMPEVTKTWQKHSLNKNWVFLKLDPLVSLDEFRQARANSDMTSGHVLGSYQQSTSWSSTLSCHTAVHKCTNFLSRYFNKECSTRPGHQDSVSCSSCSLLLKTLPFLDSIHFDLHLNMSWFPLFFIHANWLSSTSFWLELKWSLIGMSNWTHITYDGIYHSLGQCRLSSLLGKLSKICSRGTCS